MHDVHWAGRRERLCATESSTKLRRGQCEGWGVERIDRVKDGVGFDSVFIINLIISLCFPVYMEFLYCVHKGAFVGCVKNFHNVIDGAHGVAVVQEVGRKARFSYVVLVVMEMLLVPFLKGTSCLAYIFLVAIWASKAVQGVQTC